MFLPLGKQKISGYSLVPAVEVPTIWFTQNHSRRCAMPGLAHYMAQYDHEHKSIWNKVLHGIGIPLIFVGLVLLAAAPLALGPG